MGRPCHIADMRQSDKAEKDQPSDNRQDAQVRSFLSAFGRSKRQRDHLLATWWERVLAGVAVALLMALMASIVVDVVSTE
jgi:hypothetical protein